MAKVRIVRRVRTRMLPYQIVACVSAALAITFAAAAASVSAYPTAGSEAAHPELPPIHVSPFEYFPSKYQNQATEVEPQRPTF
jgi:hypothetical protein